MNNNDNYNDNFVKTPDQDNNYIVNIQKIYDPETISGDTITEIKIPNINVNRQNTDGSTALIGYCFGNNEDSRINW